MNKSNNRFLVAIPTYKESENIKKLILEINNLHPDFDILIINPCISLYKNLKTQKQNKNIKNDIIKEYFVKIKLLDNIENEEIKKDLEHLFLNKINYNEKCAIITTYNVPKYLSNENIK